MGLVIRNPFNANQDLFGRPLNPGTQPGFITQNPTEDFFGNRISNTSNQPKLNPGGVGYESSPMLARQQPLGPGIPPDRSSSYIRDPTVKGALADAIDRYRTGAGDQQTRIDEALKSLTEGSNQVQSLYDTRIKSILDSLPSAPFTDALRTQLTTQGIDRINNEGQNLRNILTQQTYGRGLSSGGSQATQGLTNIDLGEVGQRNDLAANVNKQALDVNTQANQYKQGLLAQLTGQQAGTLGQFSGVRANVGVSGAGLLDPSFVPNLIGDAASAQIGITASDDLNASIQKAIAANRPDLVQQILGGISQYFQVRGNPALAIGTNTLNTIASNNQYYGGQ